MLSKAFLELVRAAQNNRIKTMNISISKSTTDRRSVKSFSELVLFFAKPFCQHEFFTLDYWHSPMH
jgi:hypothetical protein